MMTKVSNAILILCLVGAGTGSAWAQELSGPGAETCKKAQAAIRAGHLDQAAALLLEALKQVRSPGDGALVSGLLARVYTSQGRYDEAKATLADRAAKTRESSYDVELARLILRCEPDGAAEAAAILKKVVTREPRNVDAWIENGRALARCGKLNESELAYQTVTVSLAPRDIRAHHGLTETLILKRQFARAIANAMATRGLGPETAESYCWLGRAHDRDRSNPGSYSSANEQYETAYKLDRTQTMYLGHLLFNLIMSDNHSVARSHARRLNKLPDDSVKLWFDGLLTELEGNVGGAVALYERALAVNPGNVYAYFALANVHMGRPTPGFGPVKGARHEEWRYAPHRDVGKARGELVAIRLLDPTFPFLDTLLTQASDRLADAGPAAPVLDEKGVEAMKKLVAYYKHLRLVR